MTSLVATLTALVAALNSVPVAVTAAQNSLSAFIVFLNAEI